MMVSIGTPTSSGGSGCRATPMVELLLFQSTADASRRIYGSAAGFVNKRAVIPGRAVARTRNPGGGTDGGGLWIPGSRRRRAPRNDIDVLTPSRPRPACTISQIFGG